MTDFPDTTVLSDRALACRLERCEAHANAAFVDARAALSPEIGACRQDFEGTWAMFDGIGSPLTQTFGLGLFSEPAEALLASLEQFFLTRHADVMHEVSVLADPALLPLLAAHGYRVIEWSQVLCRPLTVLGETGTADRGAPVFIVRTAERSEADGWADISAQGWRTEAPGLEDFIRAMGQVNARAQGTHAFFAEQDGVPVAAGGLHLHEGVALLAGASTIPSARGRGAQRALLEARLAFASGSGCDLAMMVAAPGSTSQKNAQRAGFRIAYSRIKWMKAAATTP